MIDIEQAIHIISGKKKKNRKVVSINLLDKIWYLKNVTVAASKRAGEGAKRGHLSAPPSTISSRQNSVDRNMQRCGLCQMFSRLVRRAMCVGSSRRGSGESYYQELADTTVSIFIILIKFCVLFRSYSISVVVLPLSCSLSLTLHSFE